MLLVPVASSDIASVGYDPVLGELQVQFTNGYIYSYDAVPIEIYSAFTAALSKGKFFAAYIKNVYQYRRIL